MGSDLSREQLIEDAAKAVANARRARHGLKAKDNVKELMDPAFDDILDEVTIALAVFEGAGRFLPVASDVQKVAHTDDERGFTATNGIRISSSWTGMTIRDSNADDSEARILTLQSRKAEALRQFFHRTAQGESAPDGWFPFGSHAPYPLVGRLEFSDEKDECGMPLWERPVQGEPATELASKLNVPGDAPTQVGVQGEPFARERDLERTIADLGEELRIARERCDAAVEVMNQHRCGEQAERAIRRAERAEAALRLHGEPADARRLIHEVNMLLYSVASHGPAALTDTDDPQYTARLLGRLRGALRAVAETGGKHLGS